MIVTDLRCGRQFIGDLVEEIPGGKALTDEQLKTYLDIEPDDEKYQQYKRPAKHRRMVLKRHIGQGYWLIPMNDSHYKVQA